MLYRTDTPPRHFGVAPAVGNRRPHPMDSEPNPQLRAFGQMVSKRTLAESKWKNVHASYFNGVLDINDARHAKDYYLLRQRDLHRRRLRWTLDVFITGPVFTMMGFAWVLCFFFSLDPTNALHGPAGPIVLGVGAVVIIGLYLIWMKISAALLIMTAPTRLGPNHYWYRYAKLYF